METKIQDLIPGNILIVFELSVCVVCMVPLSVLFIYLLCPYYLQGHLSENKWPQIRLLFLQNKTQNMGLG